MAIRVARNAAGNCVVFYGQTNPVYFNACLTAIVEGDTISVRNDIASVVDENGGQETYEFYQIPYTEFRDADNASFESAQATADYINGIGNVTDVPTSGQSFAPGETANFYRDETSTSILFSNGDHHGVNSIKAVVKDNGRVGILTINADVELYEYDYEDIQIGGSSAGGNAQTVVNNLNALFTVSAVPAPIPSPTYDLSDVESLIWNARETINPASSEELYGANGSSYHGARVYTTETISQPGEYFTFMARNAALNGGALMGIGLYDANGNDLAEILDDSLSNSGHHGYWFSNWFYNYSGYTAPWTTYGSNSGLVYGPGWNGPTSSQFRYSDTHDYFRNDGETLFRCGITDEGFVGIWYYDVDRDDGDRTNDWILCARSGTPLPAGDYGLLVKLASNNIRITSQPGRYALEPSAPALYYRYIESPDGNFQYPLFASEEEANYVDLQNGGTGTSHTHVYADDITATTWYMPDTGSTMNATSEPLVPGVTYTEIPSLTNADQVPPAFSDTTITVNEGEAVNYQLSPVDVNYVTTIGGIPNWTLVDGTTLMGTAPEVTGDNVANPSDTTTVTVYRTNSYGTSTGTLTININNLTLPVVTPISGFTHVAGSTPLVDSNTLADGSVVSLDDLIQSGNRLHIDSTFLTNNVLPALVTSDNGDPTDSTVEKFFVGIPMDGADFSDGISEADFLIGVMYQRNGTSSIRSRTISNGIFRNSMGMGASSTLTWEAVIQNYGTELELGIANASSNPENSLSATDGGTWSSAYQWYPVTDQSRQVVMGIVNTTMDISTSGLNEIANPVPSTNDTDWNKALDFSGNAERAQPVNSSPSYTPLKMGGSANQVALPVVGTNTVDSGHPWATACVFKIDGNNSNQHVWNLGEGSGTNDDNIYLRVDAGQRLYFGWGRQGAINECLIHTLSSAWWYGIYVGFNGARYGAAGSTASRLDSIFDIRLMSSIDSFGSMSEMSELGTGWTHGASSTGARMDREFNGYMTIGGRGSNRNFHGKVASFVSTTLPVGSAMPGDAEIEEMITDPKGWLYDYKAGNPYRRSGDTTNQSNFVVGSLNATAATQIWLMGDGIQDSYSNMIRNQVWSGDQNYTKLNLLSMQSNDIQNVTIPGLSG